MSKLLQAQNTLWNLLSNDEKEQHIRVYKEAKINLEKGINETIVDFCKVENNAPAATYFLIEDLTTQPNAVGKVEKQNGNTVVVFQTEDLIALLELYFGNNIFNCNN